MRAAPTGKVVTDPLSGFYLPFAGPDGPFKLLMDAVNKCNLRCVMCHFALEEVHRQGYIQWTDEVREAIERDVLPLTPHVILSVGSEPLMWKGFSSFLDSLVRAEVPVVEMITNGALLTEALARQIVASGMTKVQLSLESCEQENYERTRAGASFDDFLRALDLLNRAKDEANSDLPRLQLNFVMMRRNIDELEDLVRFAGSEGVEELDLRHLVVIPGLGVEGDSLIHDQARSNEMLERALKLAAELKIGVCSHPDPFELDGSEPAPQPYQPPPAPAPARAPAHVDAPAPAHTDSVAPASVPVDEAQPKTVELVPVAPARDGFPRLESLPERPLCDAPWSQLNVRPDGRVFPCCFWYSEEELGRVGEQDPLAIWEGERFRRLRWEILTGNLGKDCANCPVMGIGNVDDEKAHEAHRAAGEELRTGS